MSFLKGVNRLRKALMKHATKNIGVTTLAQPVGPLSEVEIRRVLICRPNHRLGNMLLVSPLVQDVTEVFPQAKIDLFVKGGIAPTLFKNYENINHIIQLPKKPQRDLLKYLRGWTTIKRNRYDLVINVVNHSSSGKLSAQFANAKHKFFGEINEEIMARHPDHEHMAKYPVYSFRYFIAKLGFAKNEKPVPPLNLKLSPAEIAEGKLLLDTLVTNERKTLSIYTYATGTKCYSRAWWEEFYERLVREFPEYNILEVLPVENVSQIDFKAPSFYSKDLRQIGSLISNTEVFIGADSGMMHLASASLAPTVGLFKALNINTYAPYGNNSVGINTESIGIDGCITMIKGILNRNLTRRAGG